MKNLIKILAVLNMIYVILISDNPDYNVFKLPIVVFIGLGLLHFFYKDFLKYITRYQ